MNKPRAIGLLESLVKGLQWIDPQNVIKLANDSNFSRDGAVRVLKEAIKLLESDEKKTCKWKNDEMLYLRTECSHAIISRYLKEFTYCPFCGGEIMEVKR